MLTARTNMKVREASRSSATRATVSSPTARLGDVRATALVRAALLRLEGEYHDMPGLSLTLPQAARLLALNHSTCERVLAKLIERRILRQAPNGTFVRR